MLRRSEVDGRRITLQASGNPATGESWVRVFSNAQEPGAVASIALTYPMRSYAAAVQFVTAADDATFRRALEQLQGQNDVIAMLNEGLLRAGGRKT